MGLKAVSRTIAGAADYETGSWTPVLEGSTVAVAQTYANQVGRFVKVGPLVWVTSITTLSAFDASTSGSMLITGLPFLVSDVGGIAPVMTVGRFQDVSLDVAGGYYFPPLQAQNGSRYVQINQFGDNVSDKAVGHTSISGATAIRFSGIYTTGLT